MTKQNDIKQFVTLFHDKMTKETRDASFDYCYNYFYQTSFENLKKDIEKSCLVLGFYLASWGMLRGSSFLMQKSAKFYEPIIEFIAKEKEQKEKGCLNLWDIDIDKYTEENIEYIIDRYNDLEKEIQKKINTSKPISKILLTKIMLGVFGCIPAFDSYFENGFKILFNIKGSIPSINKDYTSLKYLYLFYEDNKIEIDKLYECIKTIDFKTGKETEIHYTKAKIIDMYIFTKEVIISKLVNILDIIIKKNLKDLTVFNKEKIKDKSFCLKNNCLVLEDKIFIEILTYNSEYAIEVKFNDLFLLRLSQNEILELRINEITNKFIYYKIHKNVYKLNTYILFYNNELDNLYQPAFFFINLKCTKNINEILKSENIDDKSTLFHEYIHFLQDISTNYGLQYICFIVDFLKGVVNEIYTRKNILPPILPFSFPSIDINESLYYVFEGETNFEYDNLQKDYKIENIDVRRNNEVEFPDIKNLDIEFNAENVDLTECKIA